MVDTGSPLRAITEEDVKGAWHWALVTFVAEHDPITGDGNALKERLAFVFRPPIGVRPEAHAFDLGKQKEHAYAAPDGSWVMWRLQSVDRVEQLFDVQIIDGTEVFWEYVDN